MYKLELKSSHEVIDTVDVVNIESIFCGKPTDPDILTVVMKDGKRLYCDEVCPVDSLQKEPVSEGLNIAAKVYANNITDKFGYRLQLRRAVCFGAKWQKEHLWKPADGEDLPEYEREVVVFTQNFPNDAGIMTVAIAHRQDPKGLDGKSITTGKVEHYTPKTYGKGGWNIPDVIMWLDVDLPKLEED